MRAPNPLTISLVALGFVAAGAGMHLIYKRSFTGWEHETRAKVEPRPKGPAQPVTIRPGPSTPTVLMQSRTVAGTEERVACSTCHTTRPANRGMKDAAELREFHQGLQYRHGGQSCLSCHNADNYDTLRRADGSAVAYPDTLQLCSQCHGPQYRDYQHGAHGGMNGHWDLGKGGRVRNTCTDCHDPHAPLYPKVMPVFAPVDTGARQQAARAAAGHHP